MLEGLLLRAGRQCRLGESAKLTAAVRSTSFLLLRIKQASPLSILQNGGCSVWLRTQTASPGGQEKPEG